MKDFLKFMYVGFLEGYDWISRSLLLMLNGLVWLSTVWLIVVVVDFAFKEDYKEVMVLGDKVYHKDYYYNTTVGNVTTINYVPESFELVYTDQVEVVSCTVNEDFYDKSSIGESKVVSYYKGLTSMTYCVTIGD